MASGTVCGQIVKLTKTKESIGTVEREKLKETCCDSVLYIMMKRFMLLLATKINME